MLALPEIIKIDPVETCNLLWRMFHVSFMPSEERRVFDISLALKLMALKGTFASVGSSFEPLKYKNFHTLMRGLADLMGEGNRTLNAHVLTFRDGKTKTL